MANLFFPQLSSGAMAQYPIRKRTSIRTIKNILADGSMFVAADPGAGQLLWTLNYVNLAPTDMQALQNHFSACGGPFRAFTFLDPTDNLLIYSADLTQSPWVIPAGVTLTAGIVDPNGSAGAFRLTNTTPAIQQVSQTLNAPAGFQYCFSVYAQAGGAETCTLITSSANAGNSTLCQVGSAWSRISASGALDDTGVGYTAAVSLAPGQTITLYGPQLEPQFEPSRLRFTYSSGGLYPHAHWAASELVFTPEGPNLFSTSFSIETSVWN